MFDSLRLGSEGALVETNLLRKIFKKTFGHVGIGYAVKLHALKSILNQLNTPIYHILDVGCSSGMYTFFLENRFPDAEILGIDGDKGAIEEANTILKKRKLKCRSLNFREFRFEKLNQLEIKWFDLIIALDSLYYTPDGLEHLSEIASYLNPKGHIVVSFPQLSRYYGKNFPYYTGFVDVHAWNDLYSYESICKLLTTKGLKIISTAHYPSQLLASIIAFQRKYPVFIHLFYPIFAIYARFFWRGDKAQATHFIIKAQKV